MAARWDQILTMPVQQPSTIEFSSADLTWSKVEGWRQVMDKVALIPFSRVDDFVRGESANPECPTRFHVEARRRKPKGMGYKPRVDGYIEYILYWCSFGPDDHRVGGISRPSRSFKPPKKSPAGRPGQKRGCTCHFIVKRLMAEPSVALIIYNHREHIDKSGLPCHGPQDGQALGTGAMFAPYISDELRQQVISLLYVGVPVESIMQRRNEEVKRQGGPRNRDDLLSHRYVRRTERSIRRSTYKRDPDDGLQQMIQFGNRSLIACDSRLGTRKLTYPVCTLLVFDSKRNAIPVAWILSPWFAKDIAHKWMKALYDRVRQKDHTWQLAGFVIDDPGTDVLTIREVFRCSILICFWRVRHAWHKNVIKKCSATNMCVEMFRRLGQAVCGICRGNGDVDSFEEFMVDFVDNPDFLEYFKATWIPRLGIWVSALKSFPFASLETCASMESYHHKLKVRLLNEKEPSVYHRADWLIDKLETKVHSYFWLDEFQERNKFSRYRKDEWVEMGITSWSRASEIPDSNITLEGRDALVMSQSDPEHVHIVRNPGFEFAICDCEWSALGYLCKHVIKASWVCRNRGLVGPSISLFQYNRTLGQTLNCPPYDSLVLDHATSMAIEVQGQLKKAAELLHGRSSDEASVIAQGNGNMSLNVVSEGGDGEESMDEGHLMNRTNGEAATDGANGNAVHGGGVAEEVENCNMSANGVSEEGVRDPMDEDPSMVEKVSSTNDRDQVNGETADDANVAEEASHGVTANVAEESSHEANENSMEEAVYGFDEDVGHGVDGDVAKGGDHGVDADVGHGVDGDVAKGGDHGVDADVAEEGGNGNTSVNGVLEGGDRDLIVDRPSMAEKPSSSSSWEHVDGETSNDPPNDNRICECDVAEEGGHWVDTNITEESRNQNTSANVTSERGDRDSMDCRPLTAEKLPSAGGVEHAEGEHGVHADDTEKERNYHMYVSGSDFKVHNDVLSREGDDQLGFTEIASRDYSSVSERGGDDHVMVDETSVDGGCDNAIRESGSPQIVEDPASGSRVSGEAVEEADVGERSVNGEMRVSGFGSNVSHDVSEKGCKDKMAGEPTISNPTNELGRPQIVKDPAVGNAVTGVADEAGPKVCNDVSKEGLNEEMAIDVKTFDGCDNPVKEAVGS
ncbi:uncharacterized protein LOC18448602 isoform X2 [Amborella trichopoda]|uniref:uncharacterized protein LOC18448602 isoform X2 n=1 Tax=Amborella trichopoda TaxID=13333 RepID=UPI0009C04486|nr:uncharacterized protein LOC18448602 isoform X2 [Amborella trichopoda]|eukprot:XP_020531953.1 uncharacterized protein LOC18448602 isoform X2 [Amborella trichopoda]